MLDIFMSHTLGIIINIDHMLHQKNNLKKFKSVLLTYTPKEESMSQRRNTNENF